MKTKITVICENSVNMSAGLIAEHGVSFLIESNDSTLFDTGQGIGLINNLNALNKNINAIRRIILSHGHFDHTGGLGDVLTTRREKITVYMHESAFNRKYAFQSDGNLQTERYIGIPKPREDYENTGAEFHFVKGFSQISETIYAINEIKRPQGWKSWDSRLKQERDSHIIDDPFLDDLSLLIETGSGPVILLGCAHAGIVEILHDISSHTGHKEFHAVIGGTHLLNAPDEYINKTIDVLDHYKVKIIAPAHCSGFRIECLFALKFEKKFRQANVGAVFEF